MRGTLQDLKYAVRSLAKRPGFAVMAVAVLAVGIGANTAVFSVVRALILRPLPGIHEPGRVVELGRTSVSNPSGFDTFTYPDFLDLRSGVQPLEEIAGSRISMFSLSRGAEVERVGGLFVSANYFTVLGVRPARGRFFRPEEDVGPGEHPVVVLSHRSWENRFGGDPGVIGATVQLNRVSFTVVGVAPPDFAGHVAGLLPEVFLPLMQFQLMNQRDRALIGEASIFEQRNSSWFQAIGRLAPGATVAQADQAVKAVYQALAQTYPDSHGNRTARVLPLGPVPGGGRTFAAGFLAALMVFVALILVVTCTNVAGVFLARATAREKEIAVRLAVGAGRRRLVRQLVLEVLLVFAAGGALGALLAASAIAALPLDRLPIPVSFDLELSPDGSVLAFTLLATLATGLLFGLLPSLQATRLDVVAAMREGARRRSARGSVLQKAFVTGQVGLSLVLLMAAGLFLRALQRASAVETGFDPRGTYTTGIDLSMEGYQAGPEALVFQESLLERLRATPGVEAAALANDLPLDMSRNSSDVWPEGYQSENGRGINVDFNTVSEGYFEALRIPLLRGRAFSPSDRAGDELVTVVSRTMAAELWPDASALGQRLRFDGGDGPLLTVVGVVEDVKNQMITDPPAAMVYLPTAQRYQPSTQVVVRAAGDLAEVAATLSQTLRDADAALSSTPVVSMEQHTALGVLPQRLAAWVTSALGLLALLLSGVGIYGSVAYAVAQRTREIGIRMALGAERVSVARLVVMRGLALAAPGLVVGALLSLALGPLLGSFLLGLSATDPGAILGVSALLLSVIGLASVVPARRASALDPSEALRSE